MSEDQRPVVMGVDESPGTESALRWAVDEALARNVPLRLVCAFHYAVPPGRVPAYLDVPEVVLEQPRQTAEQLIADAVERVGAYDPRPETQWEAIDGDPVRVLLDESKSAAVTVLGSRHLNALSSALLGSVGAGVAARAYSPAVVVRGPAGRPEEGASVVVGVDATEGSDGVLEYAFEHASRHQVPLRAVLCWHPDLLATMSWRAGPPAPERVEIGLSEVLAGWQEKYPDVTVHRAVVREHAVGGLVTASLSQHLLVVGSHGRHAIAGTLLGSVSQGVLHHAMCPVAVVPPHDR